VSIWEEEDGSVWVAGERHGLVIYRPDGSYLVCGRDEGLGNSALLAILPDNEGNVWLGSDGGGLTRIRPRSFLSYGYDAGLNQPMVNAIKLTKSGDMLIGTHGGGALSL